MPGEDLSVVSGTREKIWEIDGKKYKALPLRLRQWAYLEQWAKNNILTEAKELANGLNDKELTREIINEAKVEASRVSVTNPGFLASLQTFAGIQQLFWLSISRSHPEVSEAQAGNLVDLDQSLVYMDDFFYLNASTIKSGDQEGNGQAASQNTQ
jgi:hypothetical protein